MELTVKEAYLRNQKSDSKANQEKRAGPEPVGAVEKQCEMADSTDKQATKRAGPLINVV